MPPSSIPQAKQIVIAKPDRPYAEALGSLCSRHFPEAKVQLYGSGLATLTALQAHPADLLLLNLSFPDLDGVDLLLSINQQRLAKLMLVFVEQHYEPVIAALRTARVNAIIDSYTESLDSVSSVLQTINQGQIYISPALKSSLVDQHPETAAKPSLTSAETRVLHIIGTGCDNQEAALLLSLSEATVQTHRRNIMRKLKVPTSAKLVREAVRLGLVRMTSSGITLPTQSPYPPTLQLFHQDKLFHQDT